eukprot:TRINITY_DN492_c0_g2_i1.p1 TRINITY_DN492_c0_g2~~TRINITY_DN492_c0_g2_i1.p1  ORF type:complete len:713 (+),score=203.93 TRINITY_DN492_c0_g2_i1:113-2251(+)
MSRKRYIPSPKPRGDLLRPHSAGPSVLLSRPYVPPGLQESRDFVVFGSSFGPQTPRSGRRKVEEKDTFRRMIDESYGDVRAHTQEHMQELLHANPVIFRKKRVVVGEAVRQSPLGRKHFAVEQPELAGAYHELEVAGRNRFNVHRRGIVVPEHARVGFYSNPSSFPPPPRQRRSGARHGSHESSSPWFTLDTSFSDAVAHVIKEEIDQTPTREAGLHAFGLDSERGDRPKKVLKGTEDHEEELVMSDGLAIDAEHSKEKKKDGKKMEVVNGVQEKEDDAQIVKKDVNERMRPSSARANPYPRSVSPVLGVEIRKRPTSALREGNDSEDDEKGEEKGVNLEKTEDSPRRPMSARPAERSESAFSHMMKSLAEEVASHHSYERSSSSALRRTTAPVVFETRRGEDEKDKDEDEASAIKSIDPRQQLSKVGRGARGEPEEPKQTGLHSDSASSENPCPLPKTKETLPHRRSVSSVSQSSPERNATTEMTPGAMLRKSSMSVTGPTYGARTSVRGSTSLESSRIWSSSLGMFPKSEKEAEEKECISPARRLEISHDPSPKSLSVPSKGKSSSFSVTSRISKAQEQLHRENALRRPQSARIQTGRRPQSARPQSARSRIGHPYPTPRTTRQTTDLRIDLTTVRGSAMGRHGDGEEPRGGLCVTGRSLSPPSAEKLLEGIRGAGLSGTEEDGEKFDIELQLRELDSFEQRIHGHLHRH